MAAPPARLRVALCQLNLAVGDIAANERAIGDALLTAARAGAQLVLVPELAVTGYPPEDLLLKEHFLRDAQAALDRLAGVVPQVCAVVGCPERSGDVYNVAAVLSGGRVVARHRKVLLPNYGVFDEQRYFRAGRRASLLALGPHRIGLTVCEDIWVSGPPASEQALAGATLIVNLSASPYHAGKGREREQMVAARAREYGASFAYCALVGGQDELVFDGQSFVIDHSGRTIARAAQFEEDLLVCDVDLTPPAAERPHASGHRSAAPLGEGATQPVAELELAPGTPGAGDPAQAAPPAPRAPVEAEVYSALELGLRDYVRKNRFDHVVLGLSGGIDSALVACIAADALGADSVSAVVMPSRFSSSETQSDARVLAGNLGIELLELEIERPFAAYENLLAGTFAQRPADITEENLQARIRGNLLMALSNKFGWLVLTTANKSELSVGYSTLYGDSAGGFAVIKDCFKTLVYTLARHRNERGGPIPASVIERPPSAELRPGQRDSDTLPPYDVLDAILRGYVEENRGVDELAAGGLDRHEIERVIRLVDSAEYKRRQAPPGIKISERAFGRDRRMPITNAYRG